MLYCSSCHCGIAAHEKSYMVRGKRVCERCYQKGKQNQQEALETAKRNDESKERLFSFLFFLFPIADIPESWNISVDGMIKKGWEVDNILYTLKYILYDLGKQLTEENWISLIYVYYCQALKVRQAFQKVLNKNREKELNIQTSHYVSRDTTFYDRPDYNIEDL